MRERERERERQRERERKDETHTHENRKRTVWKTYELYSSGSEWMRAEAMRNGLFGCDSAAAIIVASAPTSLNN